MKFIFLDIDGVMNSEESCAGNLEKWKRGEPLSPLFSKEAVAALNYLVETTEAEVIITSTWRVGRSLGDINHIFRSEGFPYGIWGVTPWLGKKRWHEIQAYLDQSQEIGYNISGYVIVDDGTTMEQHNAHFVQTSNTKGLTLEKAAKAVEVLSLDYNYEPSQCMSQFPV